MTKADIVSQISKSTGIEKIEVVKIVELFMESVQGSLERGEHVHLRGFGSFVIKKRAETTARNFSKNTTLIIPACNIPKFKPADIFTVK
jgi:DNA-binding protein HU-beta